MLEFTAYASNALLNCRYMKWCMRNGVGFFCGLRIAINKLSFLIDFYISNIFFANLRNTPDNLDTRYIEQIYLSYYSDILMLTFLIESIKVCQTMIRKVSRKSVSEAFVFRTV